MERLRRIEGEVVGFSATVGGTAEVTVHVDKPVPTDITATIPGEVKATGVKGVKVAPVGRDSFVVPYDRLQRGSIGLIRALDERGRTLGYTVDLRDLLNGEVRRRRR